MSKEKKIKFKIFKNKEMSKIIWYSHYSHKFLLRSSEY
jgi:hypothetical protein